MIDVVCPCGRKISVPDHFAGKRGRCKGCGETLEIPVPQVPLLDSKFQFTEDDLLSAVRARPGDQPSPAQPMDVGLDLSSLPSPPVVATHAETSAKAKRRPWKDPAILIGVGGPAVVLAWFVFFLYRDQSQKSFEASLRSKKVEADDLLKRNLPVDAWRKYDEVISLADRGTTLGDDIKTELLDARERKAKLDGQVQAILERQKVAKESIATEAKEQAKRDRELVDAREKLMSLTKEYLEAQASLAKFRGTLTGAAYITNGLGYARPLPGLDVYILPAKVERQKLDGVFRELMKRPKAEGVAGQAIMALSATPPDYLIPLAGMHNIIRDMADGGESRDTEVRFLSITRDLLWPIVVSSEHVGKFTTKFDGKYRYSDLKGGEYLLCSIFDTNAAFAEWVVPIKVDKNGEIECELHNGTASLILNRKSSD